MNYINAEEFIQQPKEIQKVFLKWWIPSYSDLYTWVINDDPNCINVDNIGSLTSTRSIETINRGRSKKTNLIVPNLTEGQLIEFIKDKLSGVTKVVSYIFYRYNNDDKMIHVYEGYFEPFGYSVKTLGKYDSTLSILDIYWMVAVEIAEKEITLF